MPTSQPFRDKVVELNRSMRYIDMQMRSNEARSSAWWNNVANNVRVSPPPPETLADIGELFGVTTQRVAEMVAEQWYDVRRDTDVSKRVRSLAVAVDLLNAGDFEIVNRLTQRLAKGT